MEHNSFFQYRAKLAHSSVKAQYGDIELFTNYLREFSIGVEQNPQILFDNPCAWCEVKSEDIEIFKVYLEDNQYSTQSIKRRLSSVKIYFELAYKSGVVSQREYNDSRQIRINTEDDNKANVLSPNHVRSFKYSRNYDLSDEQGIRDRVLMWLFLDTGIRTGDLAQIKVKNLAWGDGYQNTIFRYTNQFTQIDVFLNTTIGLYEALADYRESGLMPTNPNDFLLRSSHRSKILKSPGMSQRSLLNTVRRIASNERIPNLKPTDCRNSFKQRAMAKYQNPIIVALLVGDSTKHFDSKAIENVHNIGLPILDEL